MGYYNPAPSPDEFYHHGILGMRWGVRRYQPYPSGQRVEGGKEIGEAAKLRENRENDRAGYRAAKSEFRDVRRQLAVSTKRVTTAAEEDSRRRQQVLNAEEDLDKTASKIVMPWNRAKKEKEVEAALYALERLSKFQENSRVKYETEKQIFDDLNSRLEKASREIADKYGETRLTRLKPKDISLGEEYVLSTFKTGINTTNLPLIGQWVSGKYNSKWDRELARMRMESHVSERLEKDYKRK